MEKFYWSVFFLIALIILAVDKQLFRKRLLFRFAAICAFGEALMALLLSCQTVLPIVVRVVCGCLIFVEIFSGVAYLRRAKKLSDQSKPPGA